MNKFSGKIFRASCEAARHMEVPSNLSFDDLQAEAAATGFLPETLDKVIRLLGVQLFPSF